MSLTLPAVLSSRRGVSLLLAGVAVLLLVGLGLATSDLGGGNVGVFGKEDGRGGAWDAWKGRLGWGGGRLVDELDREQDPLCSLLDEADRAYSSAFPSPPPRVPGPTTFLPYTFSHAMLHQTLRAYAAASYPNLLILDNSASGSAFDARNVMARSYGARVVRPPARLRFSQLMALMDGLGACEARRGGEGYYLWSHTDVLLLSPEKDTYERVQRAWEEVREGVRREYGLPDGADGTRGEDFRMLLDERGGALKPENNPHSMSRRTGRNSRGLGVLFFQYDRLSAVSTGLRDAAPWDVVVGQYGADCDRYARVRLAGYTIADGPSTTPPAPDEDPVNRWDSGFRLVHVHAVLSPDEMATLYGPPSQPDALHLPLDEAVEFIQEASDRAGEYAWRAGADADELDTLGPGDEAAARAEAEASDRYMDEKWGQGWDCPLEGREPAWGYGWA